jgi:hypothetical protein
MSRAANTIRSAGGYGSKWRERPSTSMQLLMNKLMQAFAVMSMK